MELQDAIRSRRSVKHFDADHEMNNEELTQLLTSAALAPTSFNMQNWHFVAVRNKETKAALCAASWNQAQVKDASVTIVLAGNLKAYANHARYLRNAPEEVRNMFAGMVPGFYDGKEALQRDEACRSIAFAGQNMMLTAKDMGYDSCPMIGFDPVKVADIIDLPEDHPALMLLTIGKAKKTARPRMGLLNFEEFVSLDKFGNNTLKGEISED